MNTNTNSIENYIVNIEKKIHSKSIDNDIKFIKTMLQYKKMYGNIGWYENNKVNEIIYKFEKMYPSQNFKTQDTV